MKIILTIVFAISIASSSFSQKINRIDLHDLQIQRLSDIPDLDFSIKLRKDLSFLTGGLSAWFLSTSKIDKPSHQGISVSFCDQGATIAQNGKI